MIKRNVNKKILENKIIFIQLVDILHAITIILAKIILSNSNFNVIIWIVKV